MHEQRHLADSMQRASDSTTEVLSRLQQLSRDTADGNATRVLDGAVDLLISSLGADSAVLLRRDPENDSYGVMVSRCLSQSSLDNCRVLFDDSVMNAVLPSQTAGVIDDMSSLPTKIAGFLASEGIRSIACAPAIVEGGSPAVLICMCSTRPPLGNWEVEILSTLANSITTVFKLRQTHDVAVSTAAESPLERLKAAMFSYSGLQELLDNTLESILSILQADSGSIMLQEDDGYRIAASRGLQIDAPHGIRPSKGGTVSSKVAAGENPVLIQGAADSHEFPGAIPRPELISTISMPLKGKRGIIGLLNINSTTPGRLFSEEELTYASSIAHHVAITVENAKLYEAAGAQTRYLGSLYKIARTITSTLELDTVLEMIMERLRTQIASDVCGLLLYERETGRIQLSSGYGIPGGSDQDYIDLISPAVKFAASSRRPVLISDLSVHPAYMDSQAASNLGLRSAVVAPLAIKRKVVGFVAAYRRERKGFRRSVVRLLLGLAELAAIAIENARLYERQSGIAHIAQRELTPRRIEPVPHFEIGCKYAPAHQVGGDYYDFVKLGEDRFGIVIADVAGKDVTAALHIAMCKHTLRALADHIPSPADLLRKMNRLIYDETEPEAFISMFYAVLNTRHKTLTYSTAGHEPGLLLRAETLQIEHVSTPGILLGVVPDATFREDQTSVNLGDILLVYTDGLVEALSPGNMDGLSVLEAALMRSHLKPAQELADNLHRMAVTRQTGRSPDDIALVALKKV